MDSDTNGEVGNEISEVDGSETGSTALVEVAPGIAMVFGDVPEGLDLAEFSLITTGDRRTFVDAVAKGSSVLNAGSQLANGLAHAQGIVRLAPETIRALQAGEEPIKSGGYFIGVLRHGHHFSNQVRWLPATGAQAAGIAASMGSALAMISIQMQLSELSTMVQANISLTESVLRSVRFEQWAELTGLEEAMTRSLAEANHIGSVNTLVWENVAGHEAALRKQRDLFRRQARNHAAELSKRSSHKQRQQYLEQGGEAILLDTHSLMVAHKAWFEYQALRAGRARLDADSDPAAAALLDEIVANARTEYDQVVAELGVLLDRVTRELSVLAELPGDRTLLFTGGRRSAREVATMAEQLLGAVEHLTGPLSRSRDEIPTPAVAAVSDPDLLGQDLRILRWHLNRDEQVLAVATVRSREVGIARVTGAIRDGGAALAGQVDGLARAVTQLRKGGGLDRVAKAWARGSANSVEALLEPGTEIFLAVTSDRILLGDAINYRAQGVIGRAIPNEQIRFIRSRTDDADRSEIDIVTDEESFGIGFRRGSSGDEVVRQLVEILVDRGDAPRRSIIAP